MLRPLIPAITAMASELVTLVRTIMVKEQRFLEATTLSRRTSRLAVRGIKEGASNMEPERRVK
jgi:hypothetical protein